MRIRDLANPRSGIRGVKTRDPRSWINISDTQRWRQVNKNCKHGDHIRVSVCCWTGYIKGSQYKRHRALFTGYVWQTNENQSFTINLTSPWPSSGSAESTVWFTLRVTTTFSPPGPGRVKVTSAPSVFTSQPERVGNDFWFLRSVAISSDRNFTISASPKTKMFIIMITVRIRTPRVWIVPDSGFRIQTSICVAPDLNVK